MRVTMQMFIERVGNRPQNVSGKIKRNNWKGENIEKQTTQHLGIISVTCKNCLRPDFCMKVFLKSP